MPKWFLALVLCLVAGGGAAPAVGDDVDTRALARIHAPPLGLPPVPVPPENPPSIEKIRLGRKLFFDRRLSFNGTMSCGMCHIPEQGFTNNELSTPVGVEGRNVRRNAPTVVNAAYAVHVFHDGRETSLETQTVAPLIAHNEMANPSVGYVISRIEELDDYDSLFAGAFAGGATVDRVGQAIASWERSMLAGNSPFDRWKYGGEVAALTDAQKRGFELFTGRAVCIACHPVGATSALFTDNSFHDTGIGYFNEEVDPADPSPLPVEIAPGVTVPVSREFMATISEETEPDLGRFEVTLDHADMFRFKTPSLRNVALTGPYMHDGSLGTLAEVVQFYNRGGVPHDGLDPLIQPLGLNDGEVSDLVAFLESLTSPDVDDLIRDARSAPIGN